MRTPPAYIQNAGVLDAPAKFPWDGEGMHFGPSQGTKLHAALEKLTVSGISTVAALSLEWLLWRFHTMIDLPRFLDYVDATLAWEIDFRYRDQSSLKGEIPNDTPVNQAFGDAVWMVRKVTADERWEVPEVNVHTTASLASIIKQVLPPKAKAAFVAWLDAATATAAKLDKRPPKKIPMYDEFATREEFIAARLPIRGQPLPREALDPESGFKAADRAQMLSRLLAGLDWKKNPFLRSPDKMKKMGFKGTPYKL